MEPDQLISLAERFKRGEITSDEFAAQAAQMLQTTAPTPPTASLPNASLDLDRRRRCGFPEVVFGPGKTIDDLRQIMTALVEHGQPVLATRIDAEQAVGLAAAFPTGQYNAVARTFRLEAEHRAPHPRQAFTKVRKPRVAVISAGTGDLPVAEEARETLEWMGVAVSMILDVGVAGPHRLAQRLDDFHDADAIVVVAGMEGALPSVVGGYVPCPVIAVPTSVGYGANFGGVSALLSMLNSCASNVAVVNIDAGFKAGYLAGLIATRKAEAVDSPVAESRNRGPLTESLSQNRPPRGGQAHFAPKTAHDHRGDGARPVPDGSGIASKDT